MRSVARTVTAWGTGLLVASLVAVGGGTGAALHVLQQRALDEALLAAAYGQAHPELDEKWTSEHGHAPFEAWVVVAGDPRVPPAAVAAVRKSERVSYLNLGDTRLVLLPIEREGRGREQHLVIAAAGPRVGVLRSVGPFVSVFAALGSGVVVLAGFAFRATTARAFGPIDRARREAEAVLGHGRGQRLTEDGPEEVRSLLIATNALLDRLDRAWSSQAQFTAEAAHELRTPVTVMLGELDVALRRPRTGEEYAAVLVSTRDEVARLGRIVHALTALARVDTGAAEQTRELVRAGDLVTRALAAEATALAAAGCVPEVVIDADPELEMHAALVELALVNLLRNVATHAPGSVVSIRVGVEGEMAVFEVDDAGPGVAEADRERLFERFARAPEARRRHRDGLGLGLALAREVARRHGGDCVLHSSRLGGTRARLTVALPRR